MMLNNNKTFYCAVIPVAVLAIVYLVNDIHLLWTGTTNLNEHFPLFVPLMLFSIIVISLTIKRMTDKAPLKPPQDKDENLF